jgi:ring-1,2-phenylacetyl-CoA epoxidase subunit PaaE
MSATAFHPLTVRQIRRDTADSVVISFDVPPPLQPAFTFVQGQYLTLRRELAGQEQRRAYSICSGIDEPDLRVGVRHLPGSVFSSWLHGELREGDAVEVMPPQGSFYVPLADARGQHHLGIAVGSGITPILSILKSVLAREPDSRFTLVYGNRAPASTMFLDELADLKDRHMGRLALHHVFSRAPGELAWRSGRLDGAKLALLFDVLLGGTSVDQVFVCGPEAIKDAVDEALRQRGFPAQRLHVERFNTPRAAVAAAAAVVVQPPAGEARITLIRDGQTRVIEMAPRHGSVLEAALEAGVDLPYSCTSGVCSTCRVRVLEGRFAMDRNFSLDDEQLAAGFALACQCRPLDGALVLSCDER